jgi:hypothetical protein
MGVVEECVSIRVNALRLFGKFEHVIMETGSLIAHEQGWL